jgi:UDPglucose 6-dehydrogenase
VRERLGPGVEADVASNPEFLREGSAVFDFMHPDRIVLGTRNERAAGMLTELYRSLGAPLIVTDPETAEMIKYASNAFLATKVSFVNELANACEAVGADIGDVVEGIGRDPRIGFGWLAPGPGWGGACLPKDTAALLQATSTAGYEFDLVRSALAVNERQRERVAAKISAATSGISTPRVAVWGLAFKAGTDDIRESPALDVVRIVMAAGARVRAYDPAVGVGAKGLDDIEIAEDPYAACQGADVLAVLTEWDAFRQVDLERVGASMASRRIVDGRNALDVEAALAAGFEYEGVGRRVA